MAVARVPTPEPKFLRLELQHCSSASPSVLPDFKKLCSHISKKLATSSPYSQKPETKNSQVWILTKNIKPLKSSICQRPSPWTVNNYCLAQLETMQSLQNQFVKTVAVDGVHIVASNVMITTCMYVFTAAIYKTIYKCKTIQLISPVKCQNFFENH